MLFLYQIIIVILLGVSFFKEDFANNNCSEKCYDYNDCDNGYGYCISGCCKYNYSTPKNNSNDNYRYMITLDRFQNIKVFKYSKKKNWMKIDG